MLWAKKSEKPQAEAAEQPAAPAFTEDVGRLLRRTRESYGQDLGRIAQALRIKQAYLDAIERGHRDRLPGPAYAIGFVRSYAEFLGLDGEELIGQYRKEVSGLRQDPNLSFLAPTPESKVPGGAVFLASALVAALAYGSWYYISSQDNRFSEVIPDLPDRLKTLAATEDQILEAQLEEEVSSATIEEINAASLADFPITNPLPQGEVSAQILGPENGAASGSNEALLFPGEIAESGTTLTSDETSLATDFEDGDGDGIEPLLGTAEEALETDFGAIDTTAPAEDAGTALEATSLDVARGEEAIIGELEVEAEPEPVSASETDSWRSLAESADAEPIPTDTSNSGGASEVAAIPQAPEIPAMAEPGTTVIDSSSQRIAGLAVPSDPSMISLSVAAGGNDPQNSYSGQQPRVYGEPNPDTRIVLRATLDCWVQVRDSSGELLLTRVLRPGDSYNVPNQPGLTLLAGNAGGLEIFVDGLTIPPLGPVGAVRRDVPLEPGRLRNGTAQAPGAAIE